MKSRITWPAVMACLTLGVLLTLAFSPDAVAFAKPIAGMMVANMAVAIPAPDRLRGPIAVRTDAGNVKAMLEDIQRAFNEFKSEREKEIADLKKGLGDTVQTEKVDRINAEITKLQKAIDETNTTMAAMKLGAGGNNAASAEVQAHTAAFNQFFRKGAENGLQDLEVKAGLRTTSDPDSGYLVPEEMAGTIDRVLGTVSVMRSLASVLTIGTGTYKKLINLGGAGYGWVGETEARPETGTPTLAELVFTIMEMYANPAATQTSLDDARIDLAQWLANEVSITFAEQEGAAFITGDGIKRPRGILAYDTVANANYSWGKLGYVAGGVAAALTDGSNNGTDKLIDLYYSLKQGYRNEASWLMSDPVMGTVRKFKDADGNYIWAPPTEAGEVSTVLGKPVSTDDNMQAIGANAFPIAFGNWKRGYLILDRFGIRVLRDPYTNKPWVHFYTTKRVGGGVQDFAAIKLLKVATS